MKAMIITGHDKDLVEEEMEMATGRSKAAVEVDEVRYRTVGGKVIPPEFETFDASVEGQRIYICVRYFD